jgi:hypothetical protein
MGGSYPSVSTGAILVLTFKKGYRRAGTESTGVYMPAIGILSQKKYFPKTGDVLIDEEDGVSWDCVRAGVYVDPRTSVSIRFVLLVGRAAEMGDVPIPKTLEDSALPLTFLKTINTILRPRGDGVAVKYRKNEKGNYEET